MTLQTIVLINTICNICLMMMLGVIIYYVKKLVAFITRKTEWTEDGSFDFMKIVKGEKR